MENTEQKKYYKWSRFSLCDTEAYFKESAEVDYPTNTLRIVYVLTTWKRRSRVVSTWNTRVVFVD